MDLVLKTSKFSETKRTMEIGLRVSKGRHFHPAY